MTQWGSKYLGDQGYSCLLYTSNVYFGEVVGTSPLRINVEQKMILGESQIVLTRNVTDFKTAVTVSWNTDDNSATLSGRKEITVHNGLAVSDKAVSYTHLDVYKRQMQMRPVSMM